MRYFGTMAGDAAIQILTIIDWVVEYLQLSNSPTPDIPGFLQSLFVARGKPAMMLTDLGVMLKRDIDI